MSLSYPATIEVDLPGMKLQLLMPDFPDVSITVPLDPVLNEASMLLLDALISRLEQIMEGGQPVPGASVRRMSQIELPLSAVLADRVMAHNDALVQAAAPPPEPLIDEPEPAPPADRGLTYDPDAPPAQEGTQGDADAAR